MLNLFHVDIQPTNASLGFWLKAVHLDLFSGVTISLVHKMVPQLIMPGLSLAAGRCY